MFDFQQSAWWANVGLQGLLQVHGDQGFSQLSSGWSQGDSEDKGSKELNKMANILQMIFNCIFLKEEKLYSIWKQV